jgi:hypothetical protein
MKKETSDQQKARLIAFIIRLGFTLDAYGHYKYTRKPFIYRVKLLANSYRIERKPLGGDWHKIFNGSLYYANYNCSQLYIDKFLSSIVDE